MQPCASAPGARRQRRTRQGWLGLQPLLLRSTTALPPPAARTPLPPTVAAQQLQLLLRHLTATALRAAAWAACLLHPRWVTRSGETAAVSPTTSSPR